jgi:hypothetical protein
MAAFLFMMATIFTNGMRGYSRSFIFFCQPVLTICFSILAKRASIVSRQGICWTVNGVPNLPSSLCQALAAWKAVTCCWPGEMDYYRIDWRMSALPRIITTGQLADIQGVPSHVTG